MTERSFHSRMQATFPLWAYLLIYVPTCLVGALLFIVQYESFVDFYEYFSGAAVPRLNAHQQFNALMLLLVGPVLLAVGFSLAVSGAVRKRLPRRRSLGTADDAAVRYTSWIAFGLSALIAALTLWEADAFSNAAAWLDHAEMVNARWTLFSGMGFFGFVNIYIVLPILAAWVATQARGVSLGGWLLLAVACAAVPVIANGLLFQKRSVVISVLIVGAVVALFLLERRRALAKGILAGAIAAAAVAYFGLVVLPSFQEASRTIKQAEELFPDAETTNDKRLAELAKKLQMSDSRAYQLAMYSVMAPISRTSSSSLFYHIVFPEHHPFYGLDVGLDVLGFGSMPDHGKVVYQYMNPGLPGSTAAPFQFVLYSQVGLTGALIGCLVIGAALGFFWVVAQFVVPDAFRAPASGIVVVFAIYLAMDSARDALISSYGVLWPAAALAAIWAMVRVYCRFRQASETA